MTRSDSGKGGTAAGIDLNGDSSLHLAAKYGHQNCAKCLVEHGADQLVVNALGETSFETATNSGNLALADMLLEWSQRPALPNGLTKQAPRRVRRVSITGSTERPRSRAAWEPPQGAPAEVSPRTRARRDELLDPDFMKEAHEEFLKAKVAGLSASRCSVCVSRPKMKADSRQLALSSAIGNSWLVLGRERVEGAIRNSP